MFRFSTRRLVVPTSTRVKQYIDHLYPREGKELLPMTDIMPNANEGMASAIEFQKIFLETMATTPAMTPTAFNPLPSSPGVHQNDYKTPAAWVCTLPGDGLLRNMGHHDTIFSPLPGNLVTTSSSSSSSLSSSANTADNNNKQQQPLSLLTFSKKKRRIQSLELTLAVQIEESSISSPNPVISRVAPAILLRGSRYQFYAPHSPGFAADLSSASHFVIGGHHSNNKGDIHDGGVAGIDFSSLTFDLEGMGAVLTQGIEPIAVGYIQRFHLVDTLQSVAQYIQTNFDSSSNSMLREKCGNGTGRGNWWFATGCLARVPAVVGNYRANFGPLGDVKIAITA